MYTYTYYFILNEEQRKKYIIDNIADHPGKHIRANIGEGISLYDVTIIKINLDNNHILYRTDFTSDIYIPNLRNAQITKTFYSLQRDSHGNEYREDFELNEDLEFMKRKLCEIKLKEAKNKVTYEYTYYFILNNDDIKKYVFSGIYDDFILINFGKDIQLYKIKCNIEAKEYPFKIYKITFKSDEEILYLKRCDQIMKTIYSKETNSNDKPVYVRNIALNKNLEYVRRRMFSMLCKNNMSIETMNNYACVFDGCMTNEHVGLEIKKVKYSGPATIVFWNDGTKTVAKCQEDMSNYKAEKGLAMAISKKVIKSEYYAIKDIKIGHNDSSIIIYWEHGTEAEIKFDNHMCDVEYCIALARVKKFFGSKTRNNTKWYEKFKSYLPKEEKKPLVVDLGHLGKSKKSDTTCEDFMPKPNTHKETEQEFVLRLFNEGYSLKKISDKTGVTMYHVRRYIDEATKPDKFKNKETKKSSNKKPRTYHKLADLEDPSWLLPEECKDIREAVKEKFKDKHMTMSLLQKEYIRECRKYKLKQCYGNGYSMYELAKIIGDTNAAGLMRIWNDMNKEGN